MAGTSQECVIDKPGVYQVGTPSAYWPESWFNNEKIVHVDCGTSHSAILTEAGRVFSLGGNRCTKPGLEDSSPAHLTSLGHAHIVRIACGREHTLFLSKQGEVFACGWNEDGQLGLGHTTDTPLPTRVLGLARVTRVAAGWFHSVALTEEGEVWVTGCNVEGQLGLGHKAAQTSFVRVPNLPGPMIEVACGDTYTALLSKSKELMLSGGNYDGQLGSGTQEDSCRFTPLVLSSLVTEIHCGGCHTVALTEDGRAWAWGTNDFGQLGTGDKNKRCVPFRVQEHISRVNAGCGNTALFTEEGAVLVCGQDTHGQLGCENTDVLTPWPTSPDLAISWIAFACEYSLLSVVKANNSKPRPRLYSEISNKEESLMRILECPVCLRIMSAPIYICGNGHSLCGACGDNVSVRACPVCRGPFSQSRNRTLEDLSTSLELPCPDCRERIPVPRLDSHAECCPERQCRCPVEKSCGWLGRLENILEHCSAAHAEQTWTELPHLHVHRDFQGGDKKYVVSAFGNIFVVIFQFSAEKREFLVAVQLVGPRENKHRFQMEVEFITSKPELSIRYRSAVCSDCKELASDDYIVLDGTSLVKLVRDNALVCQVSVVQSDGSSDRVDRVRALLEGTTLVF